MAQLRAPGELLGSIVKRDLHLTLEAQLHVQWDIIPIPWVYRNSSPLKSDLGNRVFLVVFYD